MATAIELYNQFCDSIVNDTQSYVAEGVTDMRLDRAQLHAEITDLNNSMDHPHVDERSMAALRDECDVMKAKLAKMDDALALANNSNQGYLVMKRSAQDQEWQDMEPIVYTRHQEDLIDAVAFFNTHELITNQPKE
jgi:hypothetical protein